MAAIVVATPPRSRSTLAPTIPSPLFWDVTKPATSEPGTAPQTRLGESAVTGAGGADGMRRSSIAQASALFPS